MKNSFKILRSFFTAPVFEGDEEKTRTAGILNTILYSLVVLIIGGTLAGTIASLLTNQPIDVSQGIVPLFLFIGLIVLVRLGFVRQVSFALAFVLSATTTQSLFTAGMWTPTVIAGYLLAISIAGLLAGGWSAFTISVFSLLSLGGFNYLIARGVTQAQPLVVNDFVGAAAFFSISAFLLSLSYRSTREALTQARQNELAQIKANQELVGLQATLEQRVEERTRALTTVAEISTTSSAALETEKLMQQVVDLSKERFGLYHSHIYLLNEAGDTLMLASGAGEPGRMMVAQKHAIPLYWEQSLVAQAARERRGVIVNDVTQEPDFLPNPLLPDTHAELAVPMIVGERVIGVFDVQSEIAGRFTEADLAVQTTLAGQVASAIQNAHSYAELQRNQGLLSEALSMSRLAHWEYDLYNDLFTFNDHFYSVFRTSVEQIGGYKISSAHYVQHFVHPDDAGIVGTAIQKAINTTDRHYTVRLEHRIRFPNGEIGYISVEAHVDRDETGRIIRWYGANQDVTERRQLEEVNRQRAQQQEALNLITQKIQSATTIESALQVTARELGRALGMKPTLVTLKPDSKNGE